jgi:hypothetical protein
MRAPWTDSDDALLRKALREGLMPMEIAKALNCSVKEVLKRIADLAGQHGDPTPKPDSKSGAVVKTICPACGGRNWTCEAHPDKPMGHDDCKGAGDPCPLCNPMAGDRGERAALNAADDLAVRDIPMPKTRSRTI